MKSYVPLHCHTSSSLLDGIIHPEALVVRAKEFGCPAVSATEHGNIGSAIKLCKAAREYGIKPIVGIEAYFCDDVSVKKGSKNYHMTLWVKSERGLKSLFRLLTKAHQPEAFYYRPRIDLEMLYETEDLICGTACAFGILAHPNYNKVVDALHDFFEDDFYCEIMPIDLEQQVQTNARAAEQIVRRGIKIIATGDVHYLKPEDERLHNFLLNLHTDGKMEFSVSGLYLKTYDEMVEAFLRLGSVPEEFVIEALANTLALAEKCNLDWPESEITLPQLTDEKPIDVLKARLKENIKYRYSREFKYQDRLDYECKVLEDKNFVEYFLLVYGIVKRARAKGIPFGPGRGSAAGSLMCYILGITDIDPIKEGLSFERFLNPDRSDYPDIDLDFSQRRRHEVIEDLQQEFGKDRVSYISTVSKLKLKSAFKDVARKLNVPFKIANQISEKLDDTLTMKENVNLHPGITQLIAPVPIEDLVYYTDGMTQTLRHEGMHAAGIVVAPDRVEEFGVMERRKDDRCINWQMDDVAHQGLVKIDVLGLRTLDVIDDALKSIKARHSITVEWQYEDLNTPEILKEFELGNTIGIFQFEKYSTRRLVMQLAPITDKSILVDCNALVRPGPLDSGMTNEYINRHNGTDVLDRRLYASYLQVGGRGQDIANETYNVLIYQEQVTAVLEKLAGYTVPQADVVRRTIAKKKGDMEAHKKAFIKGCKTTARMKKDVAESLWKDLETFSRYGFNKSHAAAYTELGLRQMFLKISYPLEYMAALFKFTTEEPKKIKFVEECQRLAIKLLSPDINLSDNDFKIEGDAIRIGLSAIKGIGEKSLSYIYKQRKTRPFKDILDFRLRIPKAQIDSSALRSLIYAGCFRGLGVNNKLWAQDLIDRIEENGTLKGLDQVPDVEDYTTEESEMLKAVVIPGVWKMQITPELGLNLDAELLEDMCQFIGDCDRCSLHGVYRCPVPFEYTEDSKIMVIAEAPGADEVASGRPLFGKAGDELIIKQLRPYGIKRQDLFLTNVYKCRPLNNKLPSDVTHDCWDILKMEIEILQPKFIFALGNTPREFFTGQKSGIMAAADRLRCEVEIVGGRPIPVLYSVHPASVFHSNGEENRKRLQKSVAVLAKIISGEYEEDTDENT